MKKGKRIGFVDYAAGNYHTNVFHDAIHGALRRRGFRVAGVTAVKGRSAARWGQKFDVPSFSTVAEMDPHVDCYMILAPSNPEVHLDLCREVFPFAKPTYVDKTFAESTVAAKKIFTLADRYGVPMQSTSALRYTNVQKAVAAGGRLRHMVAWGGGRSFGEYAIHPVELVISCMGPKATRLLRRGTGRSSQLLIDFSGGRSAVVNVYVDTDTPFAASLTTSKGTRYVEVDGDSLFIDNMSAVMDLFDRKTPGIDRAETLMIRRILDKADDAKALKGFVRL